jgi:hypothetical protein
MPPVPAPADHCLIVGFHDDDPTKATSAQVFVMPTPADLGSAAQVAFDAGFKHAVVVRIPNYYTKPTP